MKFFRTLIRCCSGFQPYREIRDQPIATSLRYLAQLLAVLSLVLAARFAPPAWQQINSISDWMQTHVPPFRIQQGKVLAEIAQPYRAGDADFLFILDTTGATTNPDQHARRGILVTSDTVLFWSRPAHDPRAPLLLQRHSLRTIPDAEVTPHSVRIILRAGLLATVPMLFASALVVVLGQILLFSTAAAIVERSTVAGLRWRQLFNIALHAVTPAAIIFTVYTAADLQGLDLQLIYVIAYGVFLLGATHACREPITNESRADNEWL